MYKDFSAKYYQNNKERPQKHCERYQSLSIEGKEKGNNIFKSDKKSTRR